MLLLPHLLRRFIRNGRLVVTDHDGTRHEFGSGEAGPRVAIRFTDAKVEREIFFNPELKAPEAYMDGRMVFEEGCAAYDLLRLFSVNRTGLHRHPVQRALQRGWKAMRRRQQANNQSRAARNARSHYDHPAAFYALWLDQRMVYSCAYFDQALPSPDGSPAWPERAMEPPQRPAQTLESAQLAKFRHIAAKLAVAPGMRVVDIGSGWGELAIYLAKVCGASVTGINLSPAQIAAARLRAEAAGVADHVTFVEQDYRDLAGRFDRVVSVGMMEHVGIARFDAYFEAIRRLLAPGGMALVHAIGSMSPPGGTSPFIRKYIFPGGYSPALSEVFASTERARLWVCDCEILRLHYYWTIAAWRERFAENRGAVVAMTNERFARMWEFYLAAVELGFLDGSNMVFQLLVAETRDAVPLTRGYVGDAERALAPREREAGY